MALKKTITNSKGITTRYHKIHAFETDRKIVTVTLRSFTSDAMRRRELDAEETNRQILQRHDDIEALQNQISTLMEQNEDESKTPEIQELTEQLNTKVLDTTVPEFIVLEDLNATENKVKLEYFEPLSLENLYTRLAESSGPLQGATEI